MLGYAYLADYAYCTSLPYLQSLLRLPCLPSLLRLLIKFTMFTKPTLQTWRHEGHFGVVLPKLLLVPPGAWQEVRNEGAVLGVWGWSPQLPEANGGLGAKPPAAGSWGSGNEAPSRRRHGGLGAEPSALENFAFFCKNNLSLGLFW